MAARFRIAIVVGVILIAARLLDLAIEVCEQNFVRHPRVLEARGDALDVEESRTAPSIRRGGRWRNVDGSASHPRRANLAPAIAAPPSRTERAPASRIATDQFPLVRPTTWSRRPTSRNLAFAGRHPQPDDPLHQHSPQHGLPAVPPKLYAFA